MVAYELGGLHEHAARTAGGIVYASSEGFDDVDQCFHHAFRRIEFAGVLAFLRRELRQAVLVGASEQVVGVAVFGHLHIGEQVDHFAEPSLVQFRACEVLRQDAFELLVLLFDEPHRLVDDLADLRGVRGGGHDLPTCLLRHPEDVL